MMCLTLSTSTANWITDKQFKSVPGVADVNSFGGEEKAYEISVDPNQLLLDNITHVYALPNNTDYTKWTKLAITEQNKNIINSDNWSRFYDQQPIYGYIDLTTDTFFTHVGTINKCAQNTKQTDGISENE